MMEARIRTRLAVFNPTVLKIYNDSHLHSHHQAMRAQPNPESHFRVYIVSPSFANKSSLVRHRMVLNELREEMKLIHALQITAKDQEKTNSAAATD